MFDFEDELRIFKDCPTFISMELYHTIQLTCKRLALECVKCLDETFSFSIEKLGLPFKS